MTRAELIDRITKELFENDMLNEADYNFNTDTLLNDVRQAITKSLADYVILSGTVL